MCALPLEVHGRNSAPENNRTIRFTLFYNTSVLFKETSILQNALSWRLTYSTQINTINLSVNFLRMTCVRRFFGMVMYIYNHINADSDSYCSQQSFALQYHPIKKGFADMFQSIAHFMHAICKCLI